jgi:hypothetical protein
MGDKGGKMSRMWNEFIGGAWNATILSWDGRVSKGLYGQSYPRYSRVGAK